MVPPSYSCSIPYDRCSLTLYLTAFDTNLVLLKNQTAEIFYRVQRFRILLRTSLVCQIISFSFFLLLFFLFHAAQEAASVNVYHEFYVILSNSGPPLWSSGQSLWLQIQRSRVRFPALPDFLSNSGSGTGSTQPREVN